MILLLSSIIFHNKNRSGPWLFSSSYSDPSGGLISAKEMGVIKEFKSS